MYANILVTGAAGYIGGSIVADFKSSKDEVLRDAHISAAVRSEEQAHALRQLGVDAFCLDLSDEKAATEIVLQHNINIVINTAGSLDPSLALPLVTALGKQKEQSGKPTYFLHTSGLSAFFEKTGWPSQVMKDTDGIFETEKQLKDSFPIRNTDVTVIEHAEAVGVTPFIVVPSLVYGKGSGPWNQLSVLMPGYVQGAIKRKQVFKFSDDISLSGVHISDMTAFYGRIVTKAIRDEPLQRGREGYYFALAHEVQWWEVLNRLAQALKARGLVTTTTIPVWPSDEAAAEAMGVPVPFVQALWNSGGQNIVDDKSRLDWQPAWDYKRFLDNIDDEIEAVLELGKAKSSLIDSLFKAAGQ